jgi:serpin B
MVGSASSSSPAPSVCMSPTTAPTSKAQHRLDVTDALHNNRFALTLLGHLPSQHDVVISPFNLRLAMSMLLTGAAGETANQLAWVLDMEAEPVDLMTESRTVERLDRLQYDRNDAPDGFESNGSGEVESGIILHNATSIWMAAGQTILPEWNTRLVQTLGTEPHRFPPDGDVNATRRAINRWTNENTGGLIPDLIPRGGTTINAGLVVVAATYFYGAWADPFDPALTTSHSFMRAKGDTTTVPTMQRDGPAQVHCTPDLDVVRIAYRGGKLSLVIVAPRFKTPMAFIRDLSLSALEALLPVEAPRNIRLFLPRFRIDYTGALGSTLVTMGALDAFDPNTADFSGITGDRSLAVHEILHRVIIDVNEAGTEAAAAGSGSDLPRGATTQREVRIDRPFVFLLVEDATQLILFAGQVVDPAVGV